jgi:SAM-dependent methyltransferase
MGTSRIGVMAGVVRQLVRTPDRAAHGLLLRDIDRYLRLQFLGVASRSGIAAALTGGASRRGEIATRAGVVDSDVLEAFLELGVALGELRKRGDGYSIRGRRLRAIAGRSPDLRGLVEEVPAYENIIYTALEGHLVRGDRADYLTGFGPIIADASRMAEIALGPTIRTIARSVTPSTVLDVGCGSGVYLAHALDACPNATGLGIDIDPAVAERAAVSLPVGRGEARHASLDSFEGGPFDLVLLLNNIYYWPPDDRVAALGRVRALTPTGTAVVASAVPSGQAFTRHLDLIVRVSTGSYRLPTKGELTNDLRAAGFGQVDLLEPIPGAGLVVAVAS